jgi:glycine N-methyltransferase
MISGVSDQYSDGRAAKVWQLYIGESNERTDKYKNFIVGLLRKNGCKNVFDAACGTG